MCSFPPSRIWLKHYQFASNVQLSAKQDVSGSHHYTDPHISQMNKTMQQPLLFLDQEGDRDIHRWTQERQRRLLSVTRKSETRVFPGITVRMLQGSQQLQNKTAKQAATTYFHAATQSARVVLFLQVGCFVGWLLNIPATC